MNSFLYLARGKILYKMEIVSYALILDPCV